MTKAALEPGDLIAGKYRVVRIVGAGAMGAVLAADHLHLAKPVAIKVMTADANEVALARFAREAKAVAQIESDHVCKVFDVGTLDDGRPFMVMELLDGQDLSQMAQRGHRFAVDEAVHYVLEACEALAEAHIRGIVHRDLKPSNLFLAKRNDGSARIKLLDFGISKSLDDGASHGLTQTDTIVGSPRFMSPEQLQSSRDADARSDIWSLGVVLHELLSGEAAFGGGTLAELFVKILQEDPKPLRDRRPDVPPGLERVLASCFEKDRDDRYQNVAELALALAPFGRPEGKPYVDRIVGLFEGQGWRRKLDEAAPLATVLMPDRGEPRSEMETRASAAVSSTPMVSTLPRDAAASMPPPVLATPPAMAYGESTAGVARPLPKASRGPTWRILAAALVGAALVGGVVIFVLRGAPSPEPATSSAAAAPEATAPDAPPFEAAVEEGVPAPHADAEREPEVEVPSEPEAVEAPSEPVAPRPPTPARPPVAAPKPAPAAAPNATSVSKPAHCVGDGAFVRDAQGNLKVKPECL